MNEYFQALFSDSVDVSKEDFATHLLNSDISRKTLSNYLNLCDKDITMLNHVCSVGRSKHSLGETVTLLCALLKQRNTNVSFMCGVLPDEIILQIFEHVWDSWDVDEEDGVYLGRFSSSLSAIPDSLDSWNSPYNRLTSGNVPPWFTLSMVCTKWRNIIVDTPALWTGTLSFLIKSKDSFDRIPSGMEMAQRAIGCGAGRRRPLDISLCFPRPCQYSYLSQWLKVDPPFSIGLKPIDLYLASLYSYAMRHARSLHIEARDMFIQPLLFMKAGLWPELENLTIVLQSSYCNREEVMCMGDIFLNSPKLKQVCFVNEYAADSITYPLVPSLALPWDQLTHLMILQAHGDPSDVREMFWSCADTLQVCDIRMLAWDETHPDRLDDQARAALNKDPYIITFPCLSYLFLDFNRYLQVTDSDPNTETTNAFLLGHRPNNFIAPMFDRLALPALRTLRISSAIPYIDPAVSGAPFIHSTYPFEDFGLVQLQDRSRFTLELFEIDYPGMGGPQLRDFLSTVPDLESLNVRATDYAWMQVLESMWMTEEDIPDPAPSAFTFLPNLKSLIIQEFADTHISDEMYEWQALMLLNVLRKRWTVPSKDLTLESLIFDMKRTSSRPILPAPVLLEIETFLPKEVELLIGSGILQV